MSDALAESTIRLAEPEAELALAETRAVLAAAGSQDSREQLIELAEAIEAGRQDPRRLRPAR